MTAVISQPAAGSAPASAAVRSAKAKPDPRYLALRNFALSISVFNVFGYTLLGFEQPWLWPIIALATGYTTEITLELVSAGPTAGGPGSSRTGRAACTSSCCRRTSRPSPSIC